MARHKTVIGIELLVLCWTAALAAAPGTTVQNWGFLPKGTEIVGLRTERSRHYSNGDGTITTETYAYPIHRQDEHGNWVEVDEIEVGSSAEQMTDGSGVAYPYNVQYATGWVDYWGAVKNGPLMQISGGGSNSYYGWAKFDLSTLPDGVDITSAILYYCISSGTSAEESEWHLMDVDPVTASAEDVWSSIDEGPAITAACEEPTRASGGDDVNWVARPLNSVGVAAIESNLTSDWVAFGWYYTSSANYRAAYGYTGGSYRPYLRVFWVSDISASPQASLNSAYWTGWTTASTKTDDVIYYYSTNSVGWAKFDLSAVPDGATVNSVSLNYYLFSGTTSSSSIWTAISPSVDPVSASAYDLQQAIINGDVVSPSATEPPAPAWSARDLNSTGVNAVEAALSRNWVAFGIKRGTGGTAARYIYGWKRTAPYLVINYTATQPHDVGAVGITTPANGSEYNFGDPIVPVATISNFTSTSEPTVPVTLRIYNSSGTQVWSDQKTPSLDPLQAGKAVNFSQVNVTLYAGTYTVTCSTELSTDQVKTNDKYPSTGTHSFTVKNLRPSITSIDPSEKNVGEPGFTLTVTGTNFVPTTGFGPGSVVRFNGSDRGTTWKSATELEAVIPAGDLLVAGEYPITVFNPNPGGGESDPVMFTVKNLVPTITDIDPDEKNVGEPGFTLTVTGTNFVPTTGFGPGSVVRFNGSDRGTTWKSATELEAAIPAGDLLVAGEYPITVFNPNPGGGESNPATFTVRSPIPEPKDFNLTKPADLALRQPVTGIKFEWEDASPDYTLTYEVYLTESPANPREGSPVKTGLTDNTWTYDLAALKYGTAYKWDVKAITATDGEKWSSNGPFTFSTRQEGPSWPPGWVEVKSVPHETGAKGVKDGAFVIEGEAATDGRKVLYVAKGNKMVDFYRYEPEDDTFFVLETIPSYEGGRRKPPSKGCAAVFGDGYVYMVKGNNTLGFWRYNVATNTWDSLANVPLGKYGKKVKGGTDMAYAKKQHDTGYVYLLKGGKTEFYRYNVLAGRWDTLDEAPYGVAKQKYDKGSFLVYHKRGQAVSEIYCHQAKYYDKTQENPHHCMFRYDVLTQRWTDTLKGMPVSGWHSGRPDKKKKSKDGAGGAWFRDNLYALKGGNTQQFFRYFPDGDSWQELDTMPGNGSTGKKKYVKSGGDLAGYRDLALFALKGNKTFEFWRWVESPTRYTRRNTLYAGVQADKTVAGRTQLTVCPNPIANGRAILRLSGQEPRWPGGWVRVFDAAGRCVLGQRVTDTRLPIVLDLRQFAAGVYLVRLDATGLPQTQKLVVEK